VDRCTIGDVDAVPADGEAVTLELAHDGGHLRVVEVGEHQVHTRAESACARHAHATDSGHDHHVRHELDPTAPIAAVAASRPGRFSAMPPSRRSRLCALLVVSLALAGVALVA